MDLYQSCTICPRNCKVNRAQGERGFCGETAEIRISLAGIHFGEEPPITGTGGSGTIFITGCNLGCLFCQNFQIAHEGMGTRVSDETFAKICIELQNEGAENINIVTGSHTIPAIADGLSLAKIKGLKIPVVWNTSAYESPEMVLLLKDVVDGWLPDLKTLNTDIAKQIFRTADYPAVAKKAIRTMAEISPLHIDTTENSLGKLRSGVIVRHLALPNKMSDTELVLSWFARHLKNKAILSLMTQYTPVEKNKQAKNITAFENRMLTSNEDMHLRKLLSDLEIDNGFYQELVESSDWLPDFKKVQTFGAKLFKPVWHWKETWVPRS